jgi:ankyrin repeat protein
MFSACVIKDSAQSLAMAKMLCDFNVDPKQPDSLNQTALFYAVLKGHTEVIDWLLEKGLSLN